MIGFRRGVEPPALAALRATRLAEARTAASAGAKLDFGGYELVKPELFRAQRNKCCYCEKLEEQARYRDVEHYRPKSLYWWLTWTWENLLFACVDCNREHKRSRFPLVAESGRLIAEQPPSPAEQPLVLDPADATNDPTVHIEFRRDRIHGRERWKPYGITDRGRATVDVCGLDRPGLLTLYASHVVDLVRPRWTQVETAIRMSEPRDIVVAWSRAVRGLLGPARPFRALSHDVLAVLAPAPLRARHGLELLRPSA